MKMVLTVKFIGKESVTIDFIQKCDFIRSSITDFSPVVLTEEIVMQLFSVVEYGKTKEFRCNPPKGRQIENHYQSRYIGIGDDAYILICPNYSYDFKEKCKNQEPDFWFCWYHSANGEWFLPIQDLNQLKYVHQLQNLFFCLTGVELILVN